MKHPVPTSQAAPATPCPASPAPSTPRPAAPTPGLPRPVFLDRRTPPTVLTLVLVAGLGPVAMNVFLPSLPGIARHFETDYALVQVAVSGYLAMTALVQLAIGPFADRYGRRPVLLACLGLFLFATVGALLAPGIETFLFFRMLQAAVASGIALSRAIVRDMVPPEKAASMIGYVTMGMAVAPMMGPAIGGGLEALWGWKASFGVLLPFGVIVGAMVYLDLGETNRHAAASLGAQLRAYPELLRSRRFWGYALAAAFASGAYFAFLGGGPYVATVLLGMAPEEMGLWFGAIALGYIGGNFISAKFSERVGIGPMIAMGAAAASVAMIVSSALFFFGATSPLALFVPIFFVGFGNGVSLPNANAGLLSARPHLAGGAAGLGGALMIGGGAALSAVAGGLLGPETGALPLTLVMLLSSLASLGIGLWTLKIEREVAAAG